MTDSVLNLGEKIALAARLAAIEHVRQELGVARRPKAPPGPSKRQAAKVGDRRTGFTDEPDATTPSRPVPALLAEYFGRLEQHTPMPRPRNKREAA